MRCEAKKADCKMAEKKIRRNFKNQKNKILTNRNWQSERIRKYEKWKRKNTE